jgi:hypothetical protein
MQCQQLFCSWAARYMTFSQIRSTDDETQYDECDVDDSADDNDDET